MAEAPSAGRRHRRPTRYTAKASRTGLTGPTQQPLLGAVDNGRPVTVSPDFFAPAQRGGGWGPFAESFLRLNEASLRALDVKAELSPTSEGASIRLLPGGHAGAIPLRSAQSGKVAGGFVVRPRFGWAGVGHVLGEIGWYTSPEFLDAPLVPGSGREVPPGFWRDP